MFVISQQQLRVQLFERMFQEVLIGTADSSTFVVSVCLIIIITVILIFGSVRGGKGKNTRSAHAPPSKLPAGRARLAHGAGRRLKEQRPFIWSGTLNAAVSTVLGASSFSLSFYFIF